MVPLAREVGLITSIGAVEVQWCVGRYPYMQVGWRGVWWWWVVFLG